MREAYPDAETRRLDEELRRWIESAPAGFCAPASTAAARYGLQPQQLEQLESGFEKLALDLFAEAGSCGWMFWPAAALAY